MPLPVVGKMEPDYVAKQAFEGRLGSITDTASKQNELLHRTAVRHHT